MSSRSGPFFLPEIKFLSNASFAEEFFFRRKVRKSIVKWSQWHDDNFINSSVLFDLFLRDRKWSLIFLFLKFVIGHDILKCMDVMTYYRRIENELQVYLNHVYASLRLTNESRWMSIKMIVHSHFFDYYNYHFFFFFQILLMIVFRNKNWLNSDRDNNGIMMISSLCLGRKENYHF